MKLAANGYSELYNLLEQGEVPIDYIKCPVSPDSRPEVERALAYRPVVLHCWGPPGYSATRPEIPESELLTELSARSGTPFLSVHLDYKPDIDGEKTQAELLAHVRQEMAKLKALCGKEVLLENVPYYPWHTSPRWATDPAFITEAIVSSGAGFLIDTAHARVAAWHRGDDIKDYLAALPLERAREIHVSGPRLAENGLRDRHMALTSEDYEIIDFVLERAPEVELITTEYAGRREKTLHYNEPDGPELLAEQLTTLNTRYRQ